MELPVVYVFTHDLNRRCEDGPHQPIEQLANLRSIPGLIVLRPADANETAEAWKVVMKLHHEPAAIVLTRQAVPTIDRNKYASATGVAQGAYVLADAPGGKPDVLLLATGSEVMLCLHAYEQLKSDGIKARVVSMPSWELFDDQPQEYRDRILPPDVTARVSVELASTFGWARMSANGHSITCGFHAHAAEGPCQEVRPREHAGSRQRTAKTRLAVAKDLNKRHRNLKELAMATMTVPVSLEGLTTSGRIADLQSQHPITHDAAVVSWPPVRSTRNTAMVNYVGIGRDERNVRACCWFDPAPFFGLAIEPPT